MLVVDSDPDWSEPYATLSLSPGFHSDPWRRRCHRKQNEWNREKNDEQGFHNHYIKHPWAAPSDMNAIRRNTKILRLYVEWFVWLGWVQWVFESHVTVHTLVQCSLSWYSPLSSDRNPSGSQLFLRKWIASGRLHCSSAVWSAFVNPIESRHYYEA